jgi:soluble lytic murein transglycosylase
MRCDTQKQDGEWRYFRARALPRSIAVTKPKAARHARQEATFFGFLAADRARQPYAICPPAGRRSATRAGAAADQGLLRAFELYAVNLPKLARREWNRALAGRRPTTQRLAADLANRRGWYDRAVFTLTSGDALRLYELRFPLASQDGVVTQAQQAGSSPRGLTASCALKAHG